MPATRSTGSSDADEACWQPGRPVLAEIDAAIPELRSALDWLLDHDETELAGRLVVGLLDYGVFRLRPDVLAWSERVLDADPADSEPVGAPVWAAAGLRGVDGRRRRRDRRAQRSGPPASPSGGGDLPPEVATIQGSHELFEGRLAEAAAWYRRAVEWRRSRRPGTSG